MNSLEHLKELTKKITDDCVIWDRGCSGDGYPNIRGVRGNRLVCVWTHGNAPVGFVAGHTCGIRRCVNPRHLRWITSAQNQQDRISHGTDQNGPKNAMAKLTTDDVLAIKESKDSLTVLAKRYSVTKEHVWNIRNGKRRVLA